MANNRGAGQLYERVAFDKRQPTSDGYGNTESDFAEVFRCRAGFTFLRGGESVIAGRLQGKQPVVVRVRASSNTRLIQPEWRIRDLNSAKVFAVQSIAETPDRAWLDVMVEQGIAP